MNLTRSLLILFLLTATTPAQLDERWFNDVAGAPSATRQAGSPAVDPVTGQLIYVRSDMSAWTWNGQTLTQVAAGGPPPREGAMIAAHDEGNVRGIVCFGGINGTSVRGDTWMLASGQWTQILPINSPPARAYGAAAKRSQRMMLSSGTLAAPGGGGESGIWILPAPCMSDTWELSTAAGSAPTWIQKGNGGVPPPPRAGATMCADDQGNLVLCGGGNQTATLSDTWMYSATTDAWVQVAVGSSPTPVNGPMTFDSRRGIGVLTAYRLAGLQTWHFDFAAATWSQGTPAVGLAPTGFTNIGYLGYDAARGECVYIDQLHGLSVLSIADAQVAGVQPATCARALGLTLVPQVGGPRLSGGGYALTVTGATPGMPVVLAGGDQPLVTPLALGPGCLAFFGNIWETRLQLAGSPTTFAVPLANAPWLIGVRIDHQVVEIDPSNGWFTAVSGDLRVVLGR